MPSLDNAPLVSAHATGEATLNLQCSQPLMNAYAEPSTTTYAPLDELLEKYTKRILNEHRQSSRNFEDRIEKLEGTVCDLKGKLEHSNDIINALALCMDKSGKSTSKGLSTHTVSQVASIRYYLTFELMIKVGVYIVTKLFVLTLTSLGTVLRKHIPR